MNFRQIQTKPTGEEYFCVPWFKCANIAINEEDHLFFLKHHGDDYGSDRDGNVKFLWRCDPVVNAWTKYCLETPFFWHKLLCVRGEKVYGLCLRKWDDKITYSFLYVDLNADCETTVVRTFDSYANSDAFDDKISFFQRHHRKRLVYDCTHKTWTETVYTDAFFETVEGKYLFAKDKVFRIMEENRFSPQRIESYDLKSKFFSIQNMPCDGTLCRHGHPMTRRIYESYYHCDCDYSYMGKCDNFLYFLNKNNQVYAFDGWCWKSTRLPVENLWDARVLFSRTSSRLYYVWLLNKHARTIDCVNFGFVTLVALSLKETAVLKVAEHLNPEATNEQLYKIMANACRYFKRK